MTASQLRRFMARVEQITETGCWIWTGEVISSRLPYGRFWLDGRRVLAHRIAYEHFKGPIPGGLVLDHLCRVPSCVNPDHLEVVTQRENTIRGTSMVASNVKKTHCKNGHELSGDNLRLETTRHGHRGRVCRTCVRDNMARFKARPGNREAMLSYWRERWHKRKALA